MKTLTDKLRDLLLEDEIYNNIMKDAVKKILERTDVLRDALLADEIFNIMKDAVKEILEKTEGYKSARERLIVSLFGCCIMTLTDSRYNIDEKIAHSKEDAEHCIKYTDIVIKNNKNIGDYMKTIEERLECLKETVANQKIKINDLDKKVDELESALRKEQAINKMIMHFLKDKYGAEFIERVESNC